MIGKAAVVLGLVSEALAVYVIAEWLAAGYRDDVAKAIPALAFIAIALVAFGLPRAMDWWGLHGTPARVMIGVAAYVALYGVLRVHFAHDFELWDLSWVAGFLASPADALRGRGPVVIGALLVIALWARSSYRASEDVDLETFPRQIALPFGIVTVVVLLSVYSDRSGQVARAAAAFYAVSVVALAFSQLGRSGASYGDLRAGGATALILLGTVGATLAAVLVFFLAFGVVAPIIGPPLAFLVTWTLTIILYPFALFFQFVFSHIFGNSNPLPNVRPPDATPQNPDPTGAEPGGVTWKDIGVFAFRGLALLTVTALIAGVIAWFTRLRRHTRAAADDGEHENLAGAFSADLRDLFGRFRRDRKAAPESPSSAIRRLYQEIGASAASTGTTRAASETPEEFAPRLHAALHTSVTNEITQAFEQSRYAGREPDARAVAELERRWKEAEEFRAVPRGR